MDVGIYKCWIDKALSSIGTFEIIGLEVNGKLAGMIVIRLTKECHHIDLIAVHKNYYRQGIGGKLMNSFLANAEKLNVPKISVVTQLDNIEA